MIVTFWIALASRMIHPLPSGLKTVFAPDVAPLFTRRINLVASVIRSQLSSWILPDRHSTFVFGTRAFSHVIVLPRFTTHAEQRQFLFRSPHQNFTCKNWVGMWKELSLKQQSVDHPHGLWKSRNCACVCVTRPQVFVDDGASEGLVVILLNDSIN